MSQIEPISRIIEPRGQYFEVDGRGFIVNPCRSENISGSWRDAVDSVVSAFLSKYPDLLSIYIRGSVALGTARRGQSDLDAIAILPQSVPADAAWMAATEADLLRRNLGLTGVELYSLSDREAREDRRASFLIKTQSVCVYGENLAEDLKDFRLGPEAFCHAHSLKRDADFVRATLEDQARSAQSLAVLGRRFAKRIVRSGFELVMEREQRYTRELYLCYKSFSKYYPEMSCIMLEALDAAIFSPLNLEHTFSLLNVLGEWLIDEVDATHPPVNEIPSFIDDFGAF